MERICGNDQLNRRCYLKALKSGFQELNMKLSVNNPQPLYQQLKAMLKKEIAEGKLTPHDRLPSERELCTKYDLSRTTVRQTIAEAVNEGLLYRIHGKGTFVAQPKIDQSLVKITGFKETMQLRGLKPSMKILEMSVISADVALAGILQIDIGDEVLHLKLLGLADDEPMILSDVYLLSLLGKDQVEELLNNASRGELFSMFIKYHQNTGNTPETSQQTFEATVADQEVTKLLSIDQGSPLFLLTAVVYSQEGKPIEYRSSYYRGDRYRFSIKRQYDI